MQRWNKGVRETKAFKVRAQLEVTLILVVEGDAVGKLNDSSNY